MRTESLAFEKSSASSVIGIRRWSLVLLLPAVGFTLVLAFEISQRVRFPWDNFIWSESPFLTNLMKLRAGKPIFGDPADANSFVYSPGLEYLSYALLRPFGKELDVRYCRGVVVALGVVASMAAALAGGRLLDAIGLARANRRAFRPFGAMLTSLVLFENFTADVCHPDNLMIAHACVTFALAWVASRGAGWKLPLAVVVFGSLGVLTKQTAGGIGVATLVGLLVVRRDLRAWRTVTALVASTLLVTGAAAASLLAPANSRFWTFDLLHRQTVFWASIHFFAPGVLPFPHRVLLFMLAPVAVSSLLLRHERAPRDFATLWLCSGAGILPSFAAFMKVFGSWNNLVVFDVWSALLVVPWLWLTAARFLDAERADGPERRSFEPRREVLAPLPVGALLLLLLTVFPTRAWPSRAHYQTGRELDSELRAAHRRHENVLVAHGTMSLIRAGYREVPLDRANTILEMSAARELGRAATRSRITAKFYDRVYLPAAAEWYGPLLALIETNYEQVGVIAAPSARRDAAGTEGLGDGFGYQNGPRVMDSEIRILRRRPN